MLVKFFATYREVAGCKRFEMPAPVDVLGLLEDICSRWSDFRPLILNDEGDDLGEDAIVLVNGRHIDHLDGVATKLADDDQVAVLPLVAGG